MKRAVFLDRDGTLNREVDFVENPDRLELLPGARDAVRRLRDAGFVIVVITNQSGIGLGLYGHAEVEEVHGYLRRALAEHGVRLMDVFYCPHHPSKGKCLCRKPGSLLLERAMAMHGIDPTRSVMIGDRERDVDAATACGVRAIRVESNEALLPVVRAHVLNA